MRRWIWSLIIVALLVIGGITWRDRQARERAESAVEVDRVLSDAIDNVEIEQWDCDNEPGWVEVSGRVENTSGRPIESVRVRGAIEGENGETINSVTGYVDSDRISGNGSATFSVMVRDPGDEGYRCAVSVESARFTKN